MNKEGQASVAPLGGEAWTVPVTGDDAKQAKAAEYVKCLNSDEVAMQFATSHPDWVSNLVIVDIAPKAYPPSQRPILAALEQLKLQNFQSFGAIDAALAPAIPEAPLRQFLMKNITRAPSRGFQWRIDLASIVKSYDQLTKPIIAAASYDRPALFVRGIRG